MTSLDASTAASVMPVKPFLKEPSLEPAPQRERHLSYYACVGVFLVATTIAVLTPFKEYYLGSYVTKPFDEVRDEVVSRQLGPLGVFTSCVHYFDTFDRTKTPLIDRNSKARLTRTQAAPLGLTEFLTRATLRRVDLLAHLPDELLSNPVDLMEDGYGPLCGSAADWVAPAQLLFGNWFPTIRHEFCRDFHDAFPRSRFFDHADKTPVDAMLRHVGDVTLGLIAVVNMSEVYLRHFNDALVVRKIMKHVQEGFLGLSLPEYTNAAADAIVARYGGGIPLRDVVALLPGAFDRDHVALVDVLGIRGILDFYLRPQQLTMGVNVNGEPAILAEVTHATDSYFTTDFLINAVGMHLVSTMHLAPFWYCAIQHTTMSKTITVSDVDADKIQQCGRDRASVLPTFAVNLMFLFQKEDRDYAKLDNTTVYTLGGRREAEPDFTPLEIPEKLADSRLLSMDGTGWTKRRVPTPLSAVDPLPTPYGYLFTPDCQTFVNTAMQQGGRNVQKYQAYLGDGLGNCAFHDSQETRPQTLCRLFTMEKELRFKQLDGRFVDIPRCSSFIDPLASAEVQAAQQENLRQIEWFMVDTTPLVRRIRVQDNTSRQIRTFLLILNLVGATYYVLEYLRILKSVWLFVHHSLYVPLHIPLAQKATRTASWLRHKGPVAVRRANGLKLQQLLYFDPTLGALQHPGTMALLYLGAVGALSNVFTLVCSATLSSSQSDSGVAIVCQPAIPLTSIPLLLTSLSSAYWVSQVALQTRTLGERMDHAANPTWYRNTLAVAVGAAGIHFGCKAGAQYLFQNVELRSDPHLYAVMGGFLMSWLLAATYAFVNYQSTARRLKELLWTRSLSRTSSKSTGRDAVARERAFLVKWGTSQLQGALHHCATPYIAQQLQAFSGRQGARHVGLVRFSARRDAVTPIGDHGAEDELAPEDQIEIHEFVMIHCVAGAARHLETVAWQTRPGTGTAYLTTLKALRQLAR